MDRTADTYEDQEMKRLDRALVESIKHVAELEALNAKLGKRIAELEESMDLCPVCLTWSWAPCDEGVLCQCCNDSRIAVLWKGRAEKLREALQNCKLPHSAHRQGCNVHRSADYPCDCGVAEHNEYIEAALAKGDDKC